MTDEERETILLIKGAISELTPEEQQKCKQIAEQIARIVLDAGEAGGLALALVGAEFQAIAD